MKKLFITLSIVSSALLVSWTSDKLNNTNSKTNPVYEIAVRIVKDGKKADFEKSRKEFIEKLIQTKGVSNDREFQSFYALPTPDKNEVFIGMTQYESDKIIGEVQGNKELMGNFMNFAQTMDLKAYVFVQPIEGGAFDLSKLAKKPGQILEVAVRKIKAGQEAEFEKMRKAFVAKLGSQDGVVQSWEFKVVNGQNTERLAVGMTVYENQEKFQKIGQATQTWAESAFFGTFEPVALQYAYSVK